MSSVVEIMTPSMCNNRNNDNIAHCWISIFQLALRMMHFPYVRIILLEIDNLCFNEI